MPGIGKVSLNHLGDSRKYSVSGQCLGRWVYKGGVRRVGSVEVVGVEGSHEQGEAVEN